MTNLNDNYIKKQNTYLQR